MLIFYLYKHLRLAAYGKAFSLEALGKKPMEEKS